MTSLVRHRPRPAGARSARFSERKRIASVARPVVGTATSWATNMLLETATWSPPIQISASPASPWKVIVSPATVWITVRYQTS